MKRLLRIHGGRLAIVGVFAVLAFGGGYALASGGSTIHACVHKGTHVLYTGKCTKGDKKLSWNQLGPQGRQGLQGRTGATGAPGAPGAAGAAGAPATTYFAWVDENGALHRGSPGVIAAKNSLCTSGCYTLTFPGTNLDRCVPIASPGQTAGNGFFSNAQVDARVDSWPGQAGNPSVIDVFTTISSSGAPRDAPFQVAVFC